MCTTINQDFFITRLVLTETMIDANQSRTDSSHEYTGRLASLLDLHTTLSFFSIESGGSIYISLTYSFVEILSRVNFTRDGKQI